MAKKYDEIEFGTDFIDELPWKETPRYTWWQKSIRKIGALAALLAISIAVPVVLITPASYVVTRVGMETFDSAYESIPDEVPSVPDLPLYSKVYDVNGDVYAQFFSENRVMVSYEEIPDHVVEALISTEDRKFWDHSGVDGSGILRAFISNYKAGTTVEGASTITQQLVENLKTLDADTEEALHEAKGTTMYTKLIEAKTAMALEEEMSKEEILETYFNTVYFGAGAYGLGAAAKKYFNKDVSELTVSEGAVIVGMVKSPATLDPIGHYDAALDRRNTVLKRMYTAGNLTEAEYGEFSSAPIELNVSETENGCYSSDYPFYCQLVREELLSNPLYGETEQDRSELLATGGLEIYTAMDPEVMDIIDEETVRALGTDNDAAAAVSVIQPGTGLLLGVGQNHQWGQDTEKKETEIVLSTKAGQPGSIFKPISIAAGLENGQKVNYSFSTASGYVSPVLDNPKGGYQNNNGENYGTLGVADAVRYSSNVWFVKLEEKVGVMNIYEEAKKIGVFDSLDNVNINSRMGSFVLGSFEVTPIEMASVYSTFASAGTTCEPVVITKVVDTRSGEVYQDDAGANCYVGMEEQNAKYMSNVLQETFNGGTARDLPLSGGREAIGKTGTTNNFGAAWFVGAVPQYSVAVWLGNPKGATNSLSGTVAYGVKHDIVYGSTISGPIWKSIMERLVDGEPNKAFASVEPASTNPAPDEVTLPEPPNVVGLEVTEAVNLLIGQGWDVLVSNSTGSGETNHVSAIVTEDDKTVTITLASGSDNELLGNKLEIYTDDNGDRYLVNKNVADELEGDN